MRSDDRDRAVQRVLWIVLIINLLVAGSKLTIGLLIGSLAMAADGIHSSLDATSNVVGLIGIAIAARPPDLNHPYGHRRFETLASMAIGSMLLLSAWELVKGSISRLSAGAVPEVTLISFVVMLITLVLNVFVAIYERRAGERLRSEVLIADSAHTRSDILVSLVVIASLIGVRFGIAWADPIATLVVVALIGLAAWKIIGESAGVLVDRAALDPGQVSRIASGVAGVGQVMQVRSRGPANDVYLDLMIEVAGPMTADQTAAIAREIRKQLRQRFEGLRDIQIAFLPQKATEPDYALVARAEGDALGIGVHEVIASTTPRGLVLEMHVEVAPDQTVGAAHQLVTHFEERLQRSVPGLARVVTHIEPAHSHEYVSDNSAIARRLAEDALAIATELYGQYGWHDVDIRAEADGGYALSIHCQVAQDMPLEEAHRMAERVETEMRARQAALHRVTIHTEPEDKS